MTTTVASPTQPQSNAADDELFFSNREIISIHLGQAGVQMSQAVWELFSAEHNIHCDGEMREGGHSSAVDNNENALKCLFEQSQVKSYVPRAIMVDLEPTVLDEIRCGHYRNLFHPDRLLNTYEDAANTYARGYHSNGKLIINSLRDEVRKALDECDNLICFMIYRALGGGTGSGLTSLLLDLLQDYKKKMRVGMSVYPSPGQGCSILEPYNSVLTSHDAIEHVDIEMLLDNEALFSICQKRMEVDNPTYRHINQIVAQVASMETACNRFRNFLYNDLETLITNLVPYPRIHFNLCSLAPFTTSAVNTHSRISVIDSTRRCFRQLYQLFSCDNSAGRYMSVSLVYRGECNPKEVYEALAKLKSEPELRFVDWVPCSFKVGICSVPHVSVRGSMIQPTPSSALMIFSNTAVRDSLDRLTVKYQHMLNKQAFVFWYLAEGMEEEEFKDAVEDINAIVKDYAELDSQELQETADNTAEN